MKSRHALAPRHGLSFKVLPARHLFIQAIFLEDNHHGVGLGLGSGLVGHL